MTVSLYEVTVDSYLQMLASSKDVLERGAEYAKSHGANPDDLVKLSLHDDMAPLSFQVISVWHHSLGAIKGMREGVFTPPPKKPDLDYAGLQGLIDEALDFVNTVNREEIDALSEKPMVFRVGEREVPFTMNNFALSFSLPNLYFHATTLYDLLRMHGVPLGKMNYLGQLRVG
ncbi:DUF1993 domain-containing protein [Congregibacter brevis]|uniref:DUF1993 domain-containing protein n=1 Tax=Congregibacter brevis TaxID=3081201 RepID=A0ABZ0ID71_9GAMM|nr:DUF1993 domain-containing protein [Congregibacter sp. IMCC45268]